jgi:hypothetical protein
MNKREAEDHFMTAYHSLKQHLNMHNVLMSVPSEDLKQCAKSLDKLKEYFLPKETE